MTEAKFKIARGYAKSENLVSAQSEYEKLIKETQINLNKAVSESIDAHFELGQIHFQHLEKNVNLDKSQVDKNAKEASDNFLEVIRLSKLNQDQGSVKQKGVEAEKIIKKIGELKTKNQPKQEDESDDLDMGLFG